MLVMDAKMHKTEPDSIILWLDESFGGSCVNMIDVRSYLIFNMWKFWTSISDLLCSDLNLNLGKLFALTWNSRWNGFLLTWNWISNAKFHQAMVITPFRWNPVTPIVIHTSVHFTWRPKYFYMQNVFKLVTQICCIYQQKPACLKVTSLWAHTSLRCWQ